MKNLLIFTHCSPKGTPSQGFLLARKLIQAGYSVTVLSKALTSMGRFLDVALKGFLETYRNDIIIVNVFGFRSFIHESLAILYGYLFRKKSIVMIRGGWMPDFIDKWPIWTKFILSLPDFVLTPHGFLLDQMTEKGFRIHGIIPNFIEIEKYSFRLRTKIFPKFLYLRGMHSLYNPEMTLRAFALVQSQYPDASLTMSGKDDEKNFILCREIIKELNIRNVKILGIVPKEKIPELAQEHDIYVQSNRIDNMPITVLEMWACGLPVVATGVDGIPYLINDGTDGVLVPSEDHQAMADTCMKLLIDPLLVERLSRNGRKNAENFSWEQVSENWLNLIADKTINLN
ncbi:MAG: glycosyltransferase family 1 protein [Desulfobacteraceae bacterium]|nr:MAG: glycosyltransferase family 1 protein [Desulfobacteraceae bacterium]